MGNIGRYVCVALPFALTLASLIALLIAGLAGVADKNLYMFQVNTTGLSISEFNLTHLLSTRSPTPAGGFAFHDPGLLGQNGAGAGSGAGGNITAADLQLANLYDVSLWGYCYTLADGHRECTKPAFNWAEAAMKNATANLQAVGTTAGRNVTVPKQMQDAMTAFGTISRWTEIVFIIAYVALGVELFLGLFANCSRAFSCATWLVSGLATAAVTAAAALATAMAVIVVGSVEASAKFYGVQGQFNTKFLAAVWISAAFAIAAGFFWLFTVCCCKPEHRERSHGRKKHLDGPTEKLMPAGAYQPLHEPEHNGFYNNNQSSTAYGAPRYPSGGRSDLAYEPFSHSRV